MKHRTLAAGLLLGCGIALLVVGQLRVGQDQLLSTERMVDGELLGREVSGEQASTLRQADTVPSEDLLTIHPPQGAVYPDSFPPPRIQWKSRGDGLVYRVEVQRGEAAAFIAVTTRTEVRPQAPSWEALKGSDGAVSVRIRAARVEADGRIVGELREGPETTFTIAASEDQPTGMMVYGSKHRPPELPDGTVSVMFMNLALLGMDMQNFEPRVLFRSAYGPEAGPGPGRGAGGGPGGGVDYDGPGGGGPHGGGPHDGPDGGGPHGGPGGGGPGGGGPDGEGQGLQISHNCVSCHDVSNDGRYVAVFSQNEEEAPLSFDAPNGFLTVLSMPQREVVAQIPHAFMPQFHPTRSELVAFSQVGETIGAKDQMMVHQGDIHILNLETSEDLPLPGADAVDRVESIPMWSPDGETVAFIRAPPNQVWHGSQTNMEIATVPFNNGKGGQAVDLRGASGNGKSNFYPDFSPDGRWLVFARADQGFFSQMSSDLWVVPATGGEARKLECSGSHAESWHRFSPDGKWLAFVTNREDIRLPNIWLSRFFSDTGTCAPAIQIPSVSGRDAHVHAFDWTPSFPWLDDGLDPAVLQVARKRDPGMGGGHGDDRDHRGDHPDEQGRGDEHGDGRGDDRGRGPRMGTAMEAPAAVRAHVDELMAAIRKGDPNRVKQLFISRELFLEVSDCDPPTVVNDVMGGRRDTAGRADRDATTSPLELRDLRLFDGRMLTVKKGEKPERCRARREVRLFQTSWSWFIDGSEESGETHLLEIEGRWYFAKF